MNKEYIKPSITVVEVQIESLLNTFSQEGNGGVAITPDKDDVVTGGNADAKEDGGNDIWGDEW